MKVSLNSISGMCERYKCAEGITSLGIDQLVEKIGAQLGAVEEVIDIGGKYEGALIVKVVECEKLEGSDHLSLCKVDDGGVAKNVERDDKGLVQVVCGAPNVHAAMLAVWLPPGMTVPASAGTSEPFVLDAREIRGQKSNGMLASLKELAIGEDHSGILEVDVDIKPGTTFGEAYQVDGEKVIDIENKMFTHRPDCFGFLGVARELAGIQGQAFKSPAWYATKPDFAQPQGDQLKLSVRNELPNLVPRFTAIAMSEIKVEPSPVWLRLFLSEIGVKSINNIVDYTNFFMLETGQPLHAYDYDKMKALSNEEATIVIRNPKPGEKLTLLGGKVVEPPAAGIMIATDKQLIGIGGVMGGADTEVDDNTKNIILECANFDMYATRRTSMVLGLFTDAATRFTKGQSPLQNLAVLAKIVDEIQRFAGGQVASPLIDDNHVPRDALERNSLYSPVKASADFINQRLGLKLVPEEMKTLLENVEIKVEIQADELRITAPFWRTDIELREDVVEEIGRLYGYDKLPLELPKRDLNPVLKDPMLELKAEIRAKLAKAGANEVLTYSFVHGNLLDVVGQDSSKAFQLNNALSPDLQYYRPSLIPSLLEKIHSNVKAGYDELALFELGKTHGMDQGEDDDGLPREFEFTALVIAAADKLKKTGAAYYQAREYLETLAGSQLEFKPVDESMRQYAVTQPYNLDRTALVSIGGGDFLGIVGEFKPSVGRQLKLPKYCAGFEIDTEILLALQKSAPSKYVELSRFPRVTQDITLKVPTHVPYQELFNFIRQALDKARPQNSFTDLKPLDIFQKVEGSDYKNFSLRLSIVSYERTLTDQEVNKVLDTVAAEAKTEFGAERI
jgi:phenylalanyl-tRNA synthetase beta chain